ncbi:M28 family metallopeptidase [Reinekea marina]|uniref:M28 family metallopeptidase n=1 Tax=Reinekea marina TaxID=1310421 RepID=A0ABV7WVM8_9GAMM|nr:M28 family metallopeptidase [Reinekea marina]MBU2862877.1 M28 family peptidase [Reinekea forsetii]MDN3649135.1 M28 family metallopeptidase [Reinekea marina]
MQKIIKKTTILAGVTCAVALSSGAFANNVPPNVSTFLDDFWSDNSLHPFECRFTFGASPFYMPRCMQASNVMEYLEDLQEIADNNLGTRAAGLDGYTESVDYVAHKLRKMGYKVTYDSFDFNAFYELGDGQLSSLAPVPTSYEWDVDFTYMSQTEAGNVTAMVEAVDLDLGLGNASTSGCEPEDFAGFTAGNIALVQRGACAFSVKAENAAAAGAVGAIVFNQGNSEDRTGLIRGTLGSEYAGGIPVFFATYDNGVAWASEPTQTLSMMADVLREVRSVDNVIAETRWGDPDNIVMLGAHLDSVFEGAGINDNGTGSAAVLEMANLLKRARIKNKVRFAWWGAEEAGLVGSTDYVQRLSPEELAKIKVYLNFDMIGSPNYFYGLYDGDGSEFDLQGPPGSAATEGMFERYFNLRAEPFEGSEISFRSDYAEFFLQGVAFGGLFTGAEGIKSAEQAALYGGFADVAFDECYHADCDDINNVNERALEVNADAIAYVTSVFANTTKAIDDEIAAAEAPAPTIQMLRSVQQNQQYDITHWGKYWIK